jgi:transcription initiation factor TFIIIB Brf1 subunit/transcription initiation factor TFIIB
MDVNTFEFVCDDGSGLVLGTAIEGHDLFYHSPTGVQKLDAVREVFDTYMVPRKRGEEDAEFYRLVKAHTRVRGVDPLARFKEVVDIASAEFNLPRDVVEDARVLFTRVIEKRRMVTEDIATRYAIASLFYVIKKRGLPVPLKELIRLFSAKRGGDLGITRALWDIQRIAGKVRQDYIPYLIKLSAVAKLGNPGKIIEDASKIAEEVKKVKSLKPSVLAIASFLVACEVNGVKPGVPKATLERAIGVSSCRDALRIAREVAYKV